MQLLTVNLPRDHKIYFLGDVHLGTKACHKEAFLGVIDRIHGEKNSRAIGMGDMIEAISHRDRRYQPDIIDPEMPTSLEALNKLVGWFMPIKEKILGLLDGNHEIVLSADGHHMKEIVCKQLGVPYGTYTAKFSIRTTSKTAPQMYKIFTWHGARSLQSYAGDVIRQTANMKEMLKRRLKNKAGDCLIMAMGHAHKLIVVPPTEKLYLVDEGGKVKQKYTKVVKGEDFIPEDHRYYLCTGGFLRYQILGVSSYVERMGFDPVQLGYPVANIENGEVVNVEKVVL